MHDIEDIYTDISNAINREDNEDLKYILNSYTNLDMLQDNYDFFFIPITENNLRTTKILLDYFKHIQLPQCSNSLASSLTSCLKQHITELVADNNSPDNMKRLLVKYLGNLYLEDNISENNSELSLNKDLVNKVINNESPKKLIAVDTTADTRRGSTEKDNISIKTASNLKANNGELINFDGSAKFTLDDSELKIGYIPPIQLIHNFCLGNSNISTQGYYSEEHLSVSGSHEDFNDES